MRSRKSTSSPVHDNLKEVLTSIRQTDIFNNLRQPNAHPLKQWRELKDEAEHVCLSHFLWLYLYAWASSVEADDFSQSWDCSQLEAEGEEHSVFRLSGRLVDFGKVLFVEEALVLKDNSFFWPNFRLQTWGGESSRSLFFFCDLTVLLYVWKQLLIGWN